MTQATLALGAPPIAAARAAGQEAADRCAARAQRQDPTFRERAEAFVLQYLKANGVSSSELITDAAKLAGIRPLEDRAFGVVYREPARANKIAFAGYCIRRKGHATSGGRLWRLVIA